MKKLISLVLAGAMTLSLLPMTAFASTDNAISRTVTVDKDTVLDSTNAPDLLIEDDRNHIGSASSTTQEFDITLSGAEWDDVTQVKINGVANANLSSVGSPGEKMVVKFTSTRARFTIPRDQFNRTARITLAGVKITDDTASLTIVPRDSSVSADTFTFARGSEGDAIVTIEKTQNFADGGEIKDIFIEEITAGSIKAGTIKLKLNSGFKFIGTPSVDFVPNGTGLDKGAINVDGDTVEIAITGSSTKAATLQIGNLKIGEDGAAFGKTANITVSGANVSRTTLEVGTFVDYGVSVSVEDKALPVIYSGSAFADADDENETLEFTIKESSAGGWILSRKTVFELPEGVKFADIKVEDSSNFDGTDLEKALVDGIDGNKITIPGGGFGENHATKKLELTIKANLSVAANFTGDIALSVGGAAVTSDSEDEAALSKNVATAKAPFTVTAENKSVAIDYRRVSVGDITITEPEAGLWEKDDEILLEVENMQFEKGVEYEVTAGDVKVDDVEIVKDGTTRNTGRLKITIKSGSSGTPGVIKLSKISLFLDRTLPVGDYALSAVSNITSGSNIDDDGKAKNNAHVIMFENFNDGDSNDEQYTAGFDVEEVELMSNYVTVATAARDQDDSTFTTNILMTLDSTTFTVDGQTRTMDVPPYLSADGRTMVPVRAITEALASSSSREPVSYVQAADGSITVMITYGSRTISMTTGVSTMYVNGTPIPMLAAPVIVNGRTFIPLRDLGRALGLDDSKIVWNESARTIEFNPVTTNTEATAQ